MNRAAQWSRLAPVAKFARCQTSFVSAMRAFQRDQGFVMGLDRTEGVPPLLDEGCVLKMGVGHEEGGHAARIRGQSLNGNLWGMQVGISIDGSYAGPSQEGGLRIVGG